MDEIERRLRAANPSPVRRDTPLSARAETDLQRIMQRARIARARPHLGQRRKALLTAFSAAAAIVAAVVTASLLATPKATAAPPLLTYTPVSGTTQSVLQRLSVEAGLLPPTASSVITSESWSADITVEEGHAAQYVQPSKVIRTRTPDLSGQVVTYAGDVRWGTVPSGTQVPKPGAVLHKESYAAGEYPLLYTTAPPSRSDALADYLSQYAGTSSTSTAGDYFRAIASLRNDWVLDGPQTAAILDFIQQLPDVSIAGEVTDRLGRKAVAVQTASRGDGAFQDLLIFDQHNGSLISAEQVYLGGLDDIQLSHPSVLDYTAWKESQ